MKQSHKSVDYGPGHVRGDHCAICRFFVFGKPVSCKKVQDPVEPFGWCELFKVVKLKASKVARSYVS